MPLSSCLSVLGTPCDRQMASPGFWWADGDVSVAGAARLLREEPVHWRSGRDPAGCSQSLRSGLICIVIPRGLFSAAPPAARKWGARPGKENAAQFTICHCHRVCCLLAPWTLGWSAFEYSVDRSSRMCCNWRSPCLPPKPGNDEGIRLCPPLQHSARDGLPLCVHTEPQALCYSLRCSCGQEIEISRV